MNEKLQQEIAAWLETIRTGAESAGNFVLTQAPLVVQQKVAWGRAFETTWLVIGAIALLALLYYAKRVYAWSSKNSDEGFSIGFLYTCLSFGVFLLTMDQLKLTLQVWLAPRLYIIEWLVSLAKEVK
jgi:hypothetical protein